MTCLVVHNYVHPPKRRRARVRDAEWEREPYSQEKARELGRDLKKRGMTESQVRAYLIGEPLRYSSEVWTGFRETRDSMTERGWRARARDTRPGMYVAGVEQESARLPSDAARLSLLREKYARFESYEVGGNWTHADRADAMRALIQKYS